MKLGKAVVMATAGVLFAGVAFAGEVKPEDVSFDDDAVAMSLSGAPGNAEEGAKVFADRKLGNCLACHENPLMKNQLFHGDVGPSLDRVANRRDPEELRAIVSNAKKVFGSETVMPGFYTIEVGADVRKDLVGVTILSAQQVEDIVAYLSTLK